MRFRMLDIDGNETRVGDIYVTEDETIEIPTHGSIEICIDDNLWILVRTSEWAFVGLRRKES